MYFHFFIEKHTDEYKNSIVNIMKLLKNIGNLYEILGNIRYYQNYW